MEVSSLLKIINYSGLLLFFNFLSVNHLIHNLSKLLIIFTIAQNLMAPIIKQEYAAGKKGKGFFVQAVVSTP